MEDQLEWNVVVEFTDGAVLHVPCESEEEATRAIRDIFEGMGVPGSKVMISDHAAINAEHVRSAFMHEEEPDDA